MKRTILNLAALAILFAGARYLHAEDAPVQQPVACCVSGLTGMRCCGEGVCYANPFYCVAL